MSKTTNYELPLVDPDAPFDAAGDINKLADAVDTNMRQVEKLGEDAHFVLTPATRTKLGGVIIGDNIQVAADGTISTTVDPYTLPPASRTQLGGVKVPQGSGFDLQPDGTLSINDNSVELPVNSVTTAKIVDKAVTGAKIAEGTVTEENLGAALKAVVDDAAAYATGKSRKVPLNYKIGGEGTLTASVWGGVVILTFNNFTFTGDGNTSEWNIADFANSSDRPSGSFVGMNSSLLDYYLSGNRQGFVMCRYSSGFLIKSNGALAASTYTLNGQISLIWA